MKLPPTRTTVFASAIVVLVFGLFFFSQSISRQAPSPPASSEATQATSYFSYSGQSGQNALELLKEKTAVEQDASGLVIAIADRRADPQKREFWAFYVNGQLASVGPADYQTQDGDLIEWKIQTY